LLSVARIAVAVGLAVLLVLVLGRIVQVTPKFFGIYNDNRTMKFIVPLLIFTFIPATAYAYFDPGSGAVLLQVMIAAVLGIFFRIRGWLSSLLRKLTNMFRR
jgi:hypothetical protein